MPCNHSTATEAKTNEIVPKPRGGGGLGIFKKRPSAPTNTNTDVPQEPVVNSHCASNDNNDNPHDEKSEEVAGIPPPKPGVEKYDVAAAALVALAGKSNTTAAGGIGGGIGDATGEDVPKSISGSGDDVEDDLTVNTAGAFVTSMEHLEEKMEEEGSIDGANANVNERELSLGGRNQGVAQIGGAETDKQPAPSNEHIMQMQPTRNVSNKADSLRQPRPTSTAMMDTHNPKMTTTAAMEAGVHVGTVTKPSTRKVSLSPTPTGMNRGATKQHSPVTFTQDMSLTPPNEMGVAMGAFSQACTLDSPDGGGYSPSTNTQRVQKSGSVQVRGDGGNNLSVEAMNDAMETEETDDNSIVIPGMEMNSIKPTAVHNGAGAKGVNDAIDLDMNMNLGQNIGTLAFVMPPQPRNCDNPPNCANPCPFPKKKDDHLGKNAGKHVSQMQTDAPKGSVVFAGRAVMRGLSNSIATSNDNGKLNSNFATSSANNSVIPGMNPAPTVEKQQPHALMEEEREEPQERDLMNIDEPIRQTNNPMHTAKASTNLTPPPATNTESTTPRVSNVQIQGMSNVQVPGTNDVGGDSQWNTDMSGIGISDSACVSGNFDEILAEFIKDIQEGADISGKGENDLLNLEVDISHAFAACLRCKSVLLCYLLTHCNSLSHCFSLSPLQTRVITWISSTTLKECRPRTTSSS